MLLGHTFREAYVNVVNFQSKHTVGWLVSIINFSHPTITRDESPETKSRAGWPVGVSVDVSVGGLWWWGYCPDDCN